GASESEPDLGDRNASLRDGCRDRRRARKHHWRRGGCRAYRTHRRVHEGAIPGVCILYDLCPDGPDPGVPAAGPVREESMSGATRTGIKLAVCGAFLVLACVFPYVLGSYYVSLISLALIAAILASSINVLAGNVGLVSLGHAGIAASAGYG